MMLEGGFEYKKALILTPERVKELENLCSKYSDYITYEATTVLGVHITFASLEELLSYDNFQKRKIKSLIVTGYTDFKRVTYCEFESSNFTFFKGYGKTFICQYYISSANIEREIRAEISDFLKKITASYWLLGKIRLLGISNCLCWLVLFYYLACSSDNGSKASVEIGINLFLELILIAISLWSMLFLFDSQILLKLFPPISFVWGEEESVFNKYEQLRKNIFWCVIIAIIVGIVVFYITNQLPK